MALLSAGSADVDRRAPPQGVTPLMVAAADGYLRLVRILLNNGADLSKKDYQGATALHFSAAEGHVALTKLLIREGAAADLEVKMADGGHGTPLHRAAHAGRSEVIRVLLDAGANPDSRAEGGQTPLFIAMLSGHVDATRELLRAKANPWLAYTGESGATHLPLDMAVYGGHIDVVREAVQQVGIRGITGCGGMDEGFEALHTAVRCDQSLGIMAILTDAGVVDDGTCLVAAAEAGNEAVVKFLLQQEAEPPRFYHPLGIAYTDVGRRGVTALGACAKHCHPCSSRIAQLLIEAGADTTLILISGRPDAKMFCGTALALAVKYRDERMIEGEPVTNEQLDSLEAIRRLLLRVEAVHATSWLWPSDVPVAVEAVEGTITPSTTLTPLRRMLPSSRRRATRRVVLWAPLSR